LIISQKYIRYKEKNGKTDKTNQKNSSDTKPLFKNDNTRRYTPEKKEKSSRLSMHKK